VKRQKCEADPRPLFRAEDENGRSYTSASLCICGVLREGGDGFHRILMLRGGMYKKLLRTHVVTSGCDEDCYLHAVVMLEADVFGNLRPSRQGVITPG